MVNWTPDCDHPTLDRGGDGGVDRRGRGGGVEVVEGDPAGVLAALVHAVAADEQAARGGLHGLVALEAVGAGVPLQRLAVGRVERADVVAADHGVAEAVAGQALPGAVADVVEAGPGVRGGGRLLEAEVAADVHRPLGDGHRVDAVEVARDPQRLDVVVAGDREGDGGVVDRRTVAAGAAADHEVLVVGGDVAGVDALDAADELEVVVPQAGAPGQQLVGLGADQADAVAVLVGDLAAGVDDQQLGVVVGELELLDGEQAVDADAAGHVVDEAGDDRAGGAVDRGQAHPGGAVHGLEVAAHVQGGVGGGQGGGLGAGVGGEAGDGGAGGQVERGDLALGDAVDGVEGAGHVQLGAVRRGLHRGHAAAAEGGPERGVDQPGLVVVGGQVALVDRRRVGPGGVLQRAERARDEDALAHHLDVPDLAGADPGGVGPWRAGHQARVPGSGLRRVRGRRRHQAGGEGREDDRDRGDDGKGSGAAEAGAWHVVSRSERSDCWQFSGC